LTVRNGHRKYFSMAVSLENRKRLQRDGRGGGKVSHLEKWEMVEDRRFVFCTRLSAKRRESINPTIETDTFDPSGETAVS
jgi:hypothetical protein